MSTFLHDRKVRQERKAAMDRAKREQEHRELIEKVKRDALKMAVTDEALKSRMRVLDIAGVVFDELPVTERTTILEEYISQMRELGSQLQEKYGASGREVEQEFGKIRDLIDAAAAMIIAISVEDVHESFIPDEGEE